MVITSFKGFAYSRSQLGSQKRLRTAERGLKQWLCRRDPRLFPQQWYGRLIPIQCSCRQCCNFPSYAGCRRDSLLHSRRRTRDLLLYFGSIPPLKHSNNETGVIKLKQKPFCWDYTTKEGVTTNLPERPCWTCMESECHFYGSRSDVTNFPGDKLFWSRRYFEKGSCVVF